MSRIVGFLAVLTCLILASSCNRNERFLGQSTFDSRLVLRSYTTDTNGYYRVKLNGKALGRVDVSNSASLATIFDQAFTVPPDGLLSLRISWKGQNTVLIDSTFPAKSINEFYLIQLDSKAPPRFYANFGESNVAAPVDSSLLKVRFYYKKPAEDPTPLPDTIKVQFYRLVGTLTQYTQSPDTSVIMVNNGLSSYVELPDSKFKFDGQDVFLGYQIVHPRTGAILQPFCPNRSYGVIDFNSNIAGKFQTATFKYLDDVSGCSGPADLYQINVLFGGN